ncbi:hypothetical protein [Stenotrophomonas sp.]|uniref:hypothetical protein n=1 Tax=Stenotrophomonas sp. TaxID=69392 RepID=UPI0028AD3563|nr:hypothetical protein [Stenotrophomonas sp.]
MRRLPALPLLACLLLAACDRAPAPEAGTAPAAAPASAPAPALAPVPAAAAADPAQAVRVASEHLAGMRSFHAELDVLGAAQPVHSAMDFVAPSNQGRPYQLRLRYSRFNDPALRIDLP